MRLTSEMIDCAPRGLNCNGDRSLILRGQGIPAIENMAVARDAFDLIDLSENAITRLGEGFPPFPRLTVLLLGANQIRTVGAGLADSLPNLQTLVLSENRIETVEALNLGELSKLTKLEVLSLVNNPVSRVKNLRLQLLHKVPSLRYINFARVRKAEREASLKLYGPPVMQKRRSRTTLQKDTSAMVRSFANGSLRDDAAKISKRRNATAKRRINKEELAQARKLIAEARSVEEVARVQRALESGSLQEYLVKVKSPVSGLQTTQ